MKNWPQSNAKPYTPDTWDKDPTKWERWNRPRIEATLEALAAEAATLPLAEAMAVKLGVELQELRADYERVLHELKAAAKEVVSLTASKAAAVNLLEMEQVSHHDTKGSLDAMRRARRDFETALTAAKTKIAALEASQMALAASLWNLREAALTQRTGLDSTVPDRVHEAGEVLKVHRPKRK